MLRSMQSLLCRHVSTPASIISQTVNTSATFSLHSQSMNYMATGIFSSRNIGSLQRCLSNPDAYSLVFATQQGKHQTKMEEFGKLLAVLPGQMAVGGHRGCGENLLSSAAPNLTAVEPAYRENTIASFKHAVNLGVSFVEFDVQVTKDGVPVIWHDDEIITRNSDGSVQHAEVKDKTLDEFNLLVSPIRTSTSGSTKPGRTNLVRNFRSKQTRKATDGLSSWECSADDGLPTLRDMFQLPEEVGFDIEVKMAVPDTVEVTPAEEVDRVVLPIVRCVEDYSEIGSPMASDVSSTLFGTSPPSSISGGSFTSNRTIMYSSFDPDVCIRLMQVQSRFPVMFLSGCGLYPHVDARRTSISAALDFVAKNKLSGLVMPASVLLANPETAAAAKKMGVKLLTYGLDNDDVEALQRQRQMGVHAAIVDDVAGALPKLVAASHALPAV